MLGQLPVPGRPSNFADTKARAYCACSGCELGLFNHFYSHLSFLSNFSLSFGDGPIWTEILSEMTVKPKTTNQPNQTTTTLFAAASAGTRTYFQ